jgi:tRNA(Ile)-lysidine synthase
MNAEKALYARVRPLAEEYQMFPAQGAILCCVSGGIDSMCLLHFLHRQSQRSGFALYACHFDHMVRPNSAEDARFVARQCQALGVPCYQTRADVPGWAREHHLGEEDAGRQLRYAWFEELAQQWDNCLIATAHNADDNAETLLLHLLRGSGLRGLGGIPPRRGRLIRPFLKVPRSLIDDYAAMLGIQHVEDATNADPDYTPRNLLRSQVMPLLRQLNPNLTDTLSATADSLRQDGAFLDARATAVAGDCRIAAGSVLLSINSLLTQPAAIAARVVQCAVEKLDPEVVLTAAQRRAVLEVCRSQDPSGHCDLPRGISAQRVYDTLVFSIAGQVEILPATPIDGVGTWEIGPWRVTVEQAIAPEQPSKSGWEFYLPAQFPLLLRPRKSEDTLKLPHRTGTKRVKKWMIEQKVPEARRDLIPVVEQDGRVAAVAGLGIQASAIPQAGTSCLHMTINQRERKNTR